MRRAATAATPGAARSASCRASIAAAQRDRAARARSAAPAGAARAPAAGIEHRRDRHDRAERGEGEGERRPGDRPQHERRRRPARRGEPREAGRGGFGRMRRQGERRGRVGELGRGGVAPGHPITGAGADRADPAASAAASARLGEDECSDVPRGGPSTPDGARPRSATMKYCSASSTRLPRGTRYRRPGSQRSAPSSGRRTIVPLPENRSATHRSPRARRTRGASSRPRACGRRSARGGRTYSPGCGSGLRPISPVPNTVRVSPVLNASTKRGDVRGGARAGSRRLRGRRTRSPSPGVGDGGRRPEPVRPGC